MSQIKTGSIEGIANLPAHCDDANIANAVYSANDQPSMRTGFEQASYPILGASAGINFGSATPWYVEDIFTVREDKAAAEATEEPGRGYIN